MTHDLPDLRAQTRDIDARSRLLRSRRRGEADGNGEGAGKGTHARKYTAA